MKLAARRRDRSSRTRGSRGRLRGHVARPPRQAVLRVGRAGEPGRLRASPPRSGVNVDAGRRALDDVATDAAGAFSGNAPARPGQRQADPHLHGHRHHQPYAHRVAAARRERGGRRDPAEERRSRPPAAHQGQGLHDRPDALGARDPRPLEAPHQARRAEGACRSLTTRRRILPGAAPLGSYTVQFDTYRRYDPRPRGEGRLPDHRPSREQRVHRGGHELRPDRSSAQPG